eukprot:GHVR01193069.1.p1 GENE.GHVR01193069.1~~GHVR01193069.1.p1  ORF type:complete len:227 (-),score=91.52 GHVR01193069.1:197-793(-)
MQQRVNLLNNMRNISTLQCSFIQALSAGVEGVQKLGVYLCPVWLKTVEMRASMLERYNFRWGALIECFPSTLAPLSLDHFIHEYTQYMQQHDTLLDQSEQSFLLCRTKMEELSRCVGLVSCEIQPERLQIVKRACVVNCVFIHRLRQLVSTHKECTHTHTHTHTHKEECKGSEAFSLSGVVAHWSTPDCYTIPYFDIV